MRACNFLSLSMLVIIVGVAATLLVAQALGFKPMAVLSGSMTPAYAVGSVVFVDTNADARSIALGDVITYSLNGSDMVVTHRVIAIDEGSRLLTTKGDANEGADSPVPFDAVIGRALGFSIPFAGGLLQSMDTTHGIAAALFLLAFLIVLLMIPVILTPARPREARPREGARASRASAKGRGGEYARDTRAQGAHARTRQEAP